MAIDLSALLDRGVILPDSKCDSRKQAILRLAGALAARIGGLSERAIFDAVMEREQLGSTGVGEGVAIPHARLPGLDSPIGGFMRLSEPIDFEAIDERPCDLVFMLLAPDSAGADHLRALAQVSRAFRRAEIRDGLRQAGTKDQMYALLCNHAATNVSAA